jgi:NAD(P)H dehydrogenase (quinone)
MPARVSDEERQGYLGSYAERLENLDATDPMFFHPWDDYDHSQRLKPGVKARTGVQWNPRAEQTREEAAAQFKAGESVTAKFNCTELDHPHQ